MKKTAVFLLLLLLCALSVAGFTSCSSGGGEIPEGMKIATCAGADYRLYVPSTWNLNTAYGISGAYYRFSEQSTVSVQKYTIEGEIAGQLAADGVADSENTAERADSFFRGFLLPTVKRLATGEVGTEDEVGELLLDGVNSYEYRSGANIGGEKYRFRHVIGERADAFYVFSFSSKESLYESLSGDVDKMLDTFCFAEPYQPEEDMKQLDENADAPEGMKLASNSDVSYRFYVPASWSVNRNESIFSASAEDRSNVSVVPYLPTGAGISIEEYFAEAEQLMQKTAGSGYERISSDTTRIFGGKNSLSYEYRYQVGGTEVRCLQVLTAHKGMIYSMTYTALPEHYDAHLEEVNAILAAFTFR